MVLFSLVLAILISTAALHLFNSIANKQMTITSLFSPLILPLLIALPFVVGLLAGSYPSFYLSAFRPIQVLKGKLSSGSKHGSFRSVLVVFQFVTSIVLIVGTIVIYKQLHFIQTKNLGYNKDQVLVIDDVYALKQNTEPFKNDVLGMKGVSSGTLSSYLPVTNSSRSDNTFSKEAVMDAKNGLDMQSWTIDYDYFKTLGIELKTGRNFSKEFGTDSTATIINEAAASILGYSDPIGKKIYGFTDNAGNKKAFTIVGVAKNFNFESLHQAVGPLAFFLGNNTGMVSLKSRLPTFQCF